MTIVLLAISLLGAMIVVVRVFAVPDAIDRQDAKIRELQELERYAQFDAEKRWRDEQMRKLG